MTSSLYGCALQKEPCQAGANDQPDCGKVEQSGADSKDQEADILTDHVRVSFDQAECKASSTDQTKFYQCQKDKHSLFAADGACDAGARQLSLMPEQILKRVDHGVGVSLAAFHDIVEQALSSNPPLLATDLDLAVPEIKARYDEIDTIVDKLQIDNRERNSHHRNHCPRTVRD